MSRERPPRWPRVVAAFLFWMGARSIYALVIGSLTPGYQQAGDAMFGAVAFWGAGLQAVLSIGAAVAIWTRWRHAVQVILAALALSASVLVAELQRVEADPAGARALYVESRRLRGLLPVPDERLDAMFSPSGRRTAWAVGAAAMLAPLTVTLWRRRDFEPPDSAEQ